ncbi:hypothetical protein C8Q76DRAFT_789323 [Earliella scabrosa]|nr:hypothetical protein C8Q76DRAFT_802177 [Earliella scabrosa]KAI0744848.1 hypothetical protein C8Q76DRAFT_789323 [Earliella scabrosa]
MVYDAPVKLFYTAPCDTVFVFGTDDAEDEDYASKGTQVYLVELAEPLSLLLCTLVENDEVVTFRPLEITPKGVVSLQRLSPTMLSMRLAHFGVFLSFEIEEILEEFKAALEDWIAENTVSSLERPVAMAQSSESGPLIGGVSAVTVLEHVRGFAGMVAKAKSNTQAKLISGNPESLTELCS